MDGLEKYIPYDEESFRRFIDKFGNTEAMSCLAAVLITDSSQDDSKIAEAAELLERAIDQGQCISAMHLYAKLLESNEHGIQDVP